MKHWFLIAGLALYAMLPISVHAETPIEAVGKFLASLDRFESAFEQSVQGAHGELIEYTTGQFYLERPKFRWQVDDPYPQVIVSNGTNLRIFDPDLEQVTERDLDEALAGTPLGLLASNDVDLAATFRAEEVATQAGQRHFVLVSLADDAPYRRIDLWLVDAQLQRIEVLDHFEQRLNVQFTSEPLTAVDGDRFELELPEGVEVVQG